MNLSWSRVALVRIPAKPAGIWQLAVEYLSGSRLVRIRVVAKDETDQGVSTVWFPCPGNPSSPDGIDTNEGRTNLLTASARRGALIAKVGGSTADVPDSANLATPYGTKKVFAVGSDCILSLAAGDGGPLFMTMNDNPECFEKHEGELHVSIEEYPT